MGGHHAVFISDRAEAQYFLEQIGPSEAGLEYMVPKAVFRCIKLLDIPARSANIIKQEILAKGGEAAVARNAVNLQGSTDVLLMATHKQYRLLCEKLRRQPFGLKALAADIEAIISALESPNLTMDLANGKKLEFGARTLIMGILNVTPDSFSDGGRFLDPDKAVARALEMAAEGADIIDVGAVSTRPGSELAGEEEELRRLQPVVKRLCQEGLTVSVDTFRARAARKVLEDGAHLINDIGYLQLDPEMLTTLADWQAPVVIMHNRMQLQAGQQYREIVDDIIAELQEVMENAGRAGLAAERFIIDPGLGFGKNTQENLLLVKRLREFRSLGRPLLVGASRKRFIGHTLDLEVSQRLEGSLAVEAIAIMNGADIVRVHDVREAKRVAVMADAVRNAHG
jgi:dihydropteroate synthase